MTMYKCFECGKQIKVEHLKKKVRCVYCGSKILYKPRESKTVVRAK